MLTLAFRSLRVHPGFVTTIVLTLTLSIGATTAMFSIVNGVLLAPLPFANADRLVWTVNHGTRPYDAMSPPDLGDWGKLNEPTDVMTYVVTGLALSVIAVAAAWIPAQRAARVDPLIAMRPE